MSNLGISKLVEEIGELQIELGQLQQALGKKLACMGTDEHWDGGPALSQRIEDEMADVTAAMILVRNKLDLDGERIYDRAKTKLDTFNAWDATP